MTARSEVRFPVCDGIELGAWLYLPKSDEQRCPAITMAHGYAGVTEHGVTRFAEAFADAGFVVLLHDHRTFGTSYRTKDAIDFYLQPLGEGARWENTVTMRSTRLARMYEPGVWVPRISPTPLLMIVASHDLITLTDLALASYEQALEPKKLVLIPGGHFDPYRDQFPVAEAAATEWFCEHLVGPGVRNA